MTLSADIIELKMNGALDDDLFIIKSTSKETKMLSANQMHNPNDTFDYMDTPIKSIHLAGFIKMKKKYEIKEKEIYIFALANEREEFNPEYKLYSRTHYKSVELKINNKTLIPSMLPENNDLVMYPLWFQTKSDYCGTMSMMDETYEGYNYYNIWENATVNLGIVVKGEGKFKLDWFNSETEKEFYYIEDLKKNKIVNITPHSYRSYQMLSTHPMAESNNEVWNNIPINDFEIINRSAVDIEINFKGETYYIDLPYPMPYINRIFVMSI
jgi:hypothetical protein